MFFLQSNTNISPIKLWGLWLPGTCVGLCPGASEAMWLVIQGDSFLPEAHS